MSALIAIIGDLGRPDLIDSMLKRGRVLAAPGNVKSELRGMETGELVERMASQGRMRILAGNAAAEARRIKKAFR